MTGRPEPSERGTPGGRRPAPDASLSLSALTLLAAPRARRGCARPARLDLERKSTCWATRVLGGWVAEQGTAAGAHRSGVWPGARLGSHADHGAADLRGPETQRREISRFMDSGNLRASCAGIQDGGQKLSQSAAKRAGQARRAFESGSAFAGARESSMSELRGGALEQTHKL
jgi:hypothetical protein